MAVDLSTTYPHPPRAGSVTCRVACDATIGETVAVTIPRWARVVSISFKRSDDATDEAGKVATAGTDNTAIGDDWTPIGAGQERPFRLASPKHVLAQAPILYLAAASASAYAHLVLEQD